MIFTTSNIALCKLIEVLVYQFILFYLPEAEDIPSIGLLRQERNDFMEQQMRQSQCILHPNFRQESIPAELAGRKNLSQARSWMVGNEAELLVSSKSKWRLRSWC